MLNELIYSQEKVFSRHLKSSDSIEPILQKVKQKTGLDTAILVVEREAQRHLLFILEQDYVAPCMLDSSGCSPLSFSDFFLEMSDAEGQIDLYQCSPVLFKCLLMYLQTAPTVVASNEIVEIENILSYVRQKKKEAALFIISEKHIGLYYFREGRLRDGYFLGDAVPKTETELLTKLHEDSALEQGLVHISLFDRNQVGVNADAAFAEEHVTQFGGPAKEAPRDATPPEVENKAEVETQLDQHPPKKSDAEEPDDTCPELWVEVLDGDRAGFVIRVSPEPVSLGRGHADVRLNDPQISRIHAKLDWQQNKLFLLDNNSTNGILVNEIQVKKQELHLHDFIQIGDVHLQVIEGS